MAALERYTEAVRGLIFAPYDGYSSVLKSWNDEAHRYLTRAFGTDANVAAIPATANLARILQQAHASGALSPPPVLKMYKGHNSFELDRSDREEVSGEVSIDFVVVPGSLKFGAGKEKVTAQEQSHYVEYEVFTPESDLDKFESVAIEWEREKFPDGR